MIENKSKLSRWQRECRRDGQQRYPGQCFRNLKFLIVFQIFILIHHHLQNDFVVKDLTNCGEDCRGEEDGLDIIPIGCELLIVRKPS